MIFTTCDKSISHIRPISIWCYWKTVAFYLVFCYSIIVFRRMIYLWYPTPMGYDIHLIKEEPMNCIILLTGLISISLMACSRSATALPAVIIPTSTSAPVMPSATPVPPTPRPVEVTLRVINESIKSAVVLAPERYINKLTNFLWGNSSSSRPQRIFHVVVCSRPWQPGRFLLGLPM